MDYKDFVACIGKSEDSIEVKALLAALGVTKKLKMPKDDIDVRHELPKKGLVLIFEPAGQKTSQLLMNGVQFVSDDEEGFKTYTGTLPGQLSFSDGPDEVHAKLGKPEKSKPDFRLDFWSLEGLQLTVNYTMDDPQRISVVSVETPVED